MQPIKIVGSISRIAIRKQLGMQLAIFIDSPLGGLLFELVVYRLNFMLVTFTSPHPSDIE